MCGIVGAISFENSSFTVTEPYLARMRDAMAHRGPDGAGVWISDDRRVGLGHRRLAIIDLSSAADQPMPNEDGSLWVAFNGEIYNHAEIRAELEQTGRHRWRTDHSDTEVILHAFEEWGIDCVHRFRGMFAIALWDARQRRLWLVRDRIGIKPLYFSFHHGRLTFASEIKALLEDPDQSRTVNEQAVFHFLSFAAVPAPQTMFEGIQKLPAATWLCVDRDGRARQQRYWDVWDHVTPLDGVCEDEIAERVLATLRESVALRKVSDVPVGVFLSGGIDSSTNAALFSEGDGRPLRTFTIGYDGDYPTNPNETPWARRIARQFGAEHHERILSVDDLLAFLPQMVHLQDEPIADPVCVPVYYVSKLARDNGVVVCQVGEGADELFCGYPGWQRILRLERLARTPLFGAWGRLGALGLQMLGRRGTWPWERLQRAAAGIPVSWSGGGEAFTEWQKRRLLSPRLRERFAGDSSWSVLAPLHREFQERARDRSPLGWMTYLDLNFRLPEILLMRVDKMSMGVSLEARVPFLDHEFVALAMSIPPALKNRRGDLKHILKRAVRGVIPAEIIDRKKQGFGVPVHEWLFGRLGRTVHRELSDFCDATDILDRSEVMRIVERGDQASWYLLNLALWWKRFIAQDDARLSNVTGRRAA